MANFELTGIIEKVGNNDNGTPTIVIRCKDGNIVEFFVPKELAIEACPYLYKEVIIKSNTLIKTI